MVFTSEGDNQANVACGCIVQGGRSEHKESFAMRVLQGTSFLPVPGQEARIYNLQQGFVRFGEGRLIFIIYLLFV